jgi:nucleoid DNA-binding protein
VIETVEILLEPIKFILEFDEDLLRSGFCNFHVKKKRLRGRNPATGKDRINKQQQTDCIYGKRLKNTIASVGLSILGAKRTLGSHRGHNG